MDHLSIGKLFEPSLDHKFEFPEHKLNVAHKTYGLNKIELR